jgi:hypothetical protein
VKEFYDYVLSFYGEGGIYAMNATLAQVKNVTATHKKILKLQDHKFLGDSYDRECVRDLLMSKYQLQFIR